MENKTTVPSHHRRSIRLAEYDYTQAGAYFITIVTYGRLCIFGNIVDGNMHLLPAGKLAEYEWGHLQKRFPGLEIDAFQVMPNHIHGIILLTNEPRPKADPSEMTGNVPAGSVAAIVRAYKSAVTLRYNRMNHPGCGPLWQRNYYEHIIRNNESLDRIRAYILTNPVQWANDQENPNR